MKITALAALAGLPVAAAAAELAGLPVDCVAFQDDAAPDSDSESTNSASALRMGQCLKPGDAICSTRGSWTLGIDPADRMIKLWEGNRVSRFVCSEIFPTSGLVLRHFFPPWDQVV